MRLFAFLLLILVTTHPVIAAENTDTSAGEDAAPSQYSSVEERRLLVALKEERVSLENQRQELEDQKKALKTLQTEVDKKLNELKQQRLELEAMLEEKDAREQQRIKELSKMYEKMTAEKAARVFISLEQSLAVSILQEMKIKSAAKILNNMDRERAAALTTAFSTLETP